MFMMALLYHKEVNLNLWVNKGKQETEIWGICASKGFIYYSNNIGMSTVMVWAANTTCEIHITGLVMSLLQNDFL